MIEHYGGNQSHTYTLASSKSGNDFVRPGCVDQRAFERAYRTVLTVLDTSTWQVACSPPITFSPPPEHWQCTQGWRGKWDVQYVHSLVLSEDGAHAYAGVEFENRCPALVRMSVLELSALVDATLAAEVAW